MQRLQFVLFQIDRAKALLEEGYIPSLRVALILLDNAQEVLLDRWIESDMQTESMFERLHEAARDAGVPPEHPSVECRVAPDLESALTEARRFTLSHLKRLPPPRRAGFTRGGE